MNHHPLVGSVIRAPRYRSSPAFEQASHVPESTGFCLAVTAGVADVLTEDSEIHRVEVDGARLVEVAPALDRLLAESQRRVDGAAGAA